LFSEACAFELCVSPSLKQGATTACVFSGCASTHFPVHQVLLFPSFSVLLLLFLQGRGGGVGVHGILYSLHCYFAAPRPLREPCPSTTPVLPSFLAAYEVPSPLCAGGQGKRGWYMRCTGGPCPSGHCAMGCRPL